MLKFSSMRIQFCGKRRLSIGCSYCMYIVRMVSVENNNNKSEFDN